MKIAMGALARAGDRRRRRADPGRHERAAQLPRADVRRLAAVRGARAVDDAAVDRPDRRRGDRRSPASSSPTGCGSRTRSARRASRRASRALHTLLRQQVVLRRGDRLRDRAARRLARPLRRHHVRARASSTARSSAAPRASCAPPRPPCARVQTGYLRYYAALLLLGAHGARRLLPDLAHDHPPVDPDLLAARCSASLGALAPRAARAGASRWSATLVAARLRGHPAVRLRHGAARPAVRHRRQVDPGARHPLQARRRRAEPVAGRR